MPSHSCNREFLACQDDTFDARDVKPRGEVLAEMTSRGFLQQSQASPQARLLLQTITEVLDGANIPDHHSHPVCGQVGWT